MTSRTSRSRTPRGRSLVGERFVVEVERVAHGGHFVAHHEGVVIFVRHALPGETVTVEVTEGDEHSSFLRADAISITVASADRVTPPCPFAAPGLCGGCDFQHVSLAAQRDLKASVIREQLQRLARLDVDVRVEPVPGDDDGLGWRTRMQYAVDGSGRAGLRKHRSHEVVHIDYCRIAHPGLPAVVSADWAGAQAVEAIVSAAGEQLRVVTADRKRFLDGVAVLHEAAGGRSWQVTGSGFWQVHPGAASILVAAVEEGLGVRPGERAGDLYSGVGLFAGMLADRVGSTGWVVAVEHDEAALEDALVNLGDLPQVEVLEGRVDLALAQHALGDRLDVVVLDPPRTGAKRPVVAGVVALQPRAVAYVACDPAALARDVAIFAELGYSLTSLRAFDLFPMTQHVECVALLEK